MKIRLSTNVRPVDFEREVNAYLSRIQAACVEQHGGKHADAARMLAKEMQAAMESCRKIYELKVATIKLLRLTAAIRRTLEDAELTSYANRIVLLIQISHYFLKNRGIILS